MKKHLALPVLHFTSSRYTALRYIALQYTSSPAVSSRTVSSPAVSSPVFFFSQFLFSFLKRFFFISLFLLVYVTDESMSQDSEAYMDEYQNYAPGFTLGTVPYYHLPEEIVKIPLLSQSISIVSVFTIKVYRITDPEKFLLSQYDRRSLSFVGKDSSNLHGLAEEVHTFTKKVYPKRKNNSFLLNDTITYIPPSKGVYLLRVFHKNKAAMCGFFVTNLSLITRTGENAYLTYTSDRMTSEPVDSVRLSLYFNNEKIAEGITSGPLYNYVLTDENKKLSVKLGYYSPMLIAVKGIEAAVSDPAMYFYGSYSPYKAHIITSQPVFRPPDKVEFKLSLRKESAGGYLVCANKKINVYVKDANGANIYRKSVKTNEYGSFSDSIFVSAEMPLGQYTITAEVVDESILQLIKDNSGVEDTAAETGYADVKIQTFDQHFHVEEYKKPEYKVEVKTDKEQYGGKDKIEISAQADYYFGSPVQDAEVTYNVFKQILYRPWWYYSEYSWWYRGYYGGNPENSYANSEYIHTGTGKLDSEGKFKVTYEINEDFKEGKNKNEYYTDYNYIVSVNVTDKSRRMVTNSTNVSVTRAEYSITSNTDRYVVKPGESIGLMIRARDFADKPVEARLTATVNRITYEKDEKTKKHKKITTYVNSYNGKTSVTGDEVIYVQTGAEGYYEFEVTSFDSRNNKVTSGAASYVTLGNMRSWWQSNEGTVEILPEKESYKQGDTAVMYVSIPHDTAHVLIANYNKYVVSAWTEYFTEGAAYVKIPITDNAAPNFFFSVSYVLKGILYTRSTSIAVIPEKKFLDVNITSDKTVYKPREEGIINVSVKDKMGNPLKNTEVTLGMIDESIYAIRPENIPDIRGAFYSAAGDGTSLSSNPNFNHYWNSYNASYPGLFEMYDYKTSYNVALVNCRLYDVKGSSFNNVIVLINDKYSAGVTKYDGSVSFKLPEGTHKIQLVVNDFIMPDHLMVTFTKEGPNKLEIKATQNRISFAKLNDEYVNIPNQEKLIAGSGIITGMITDDADGLPVIGAIVKIEGTNIATETDVNGIFRFENLPVGTYTIVVLYAGYQPGKIANITIEKDKGVMINYSMSNNAATDTIELTVQRKGIETDQSGRLITSQNIEQIGLRGINNITSKTSGIVQDERGGMVNIRGGRLLDNIVILDGNYSAEYGNALSGIINVTIDKEEEEKPEYVDAIPRNDFRDKMLWMPAVYTDENGNAQIKVKFPDNLTTWRFVARAITNATDVGQNTYDIIERKDLIIRVETPRFFQQNDEVTVSAIVHNYLNEEKKTKVSLKLENLMLAGSAPYEQEILLGKNEEKRIDWNVKVVNPTGMSNVFASALTNEESDAMEQKIPVQPFGLRVNKFASLDITGDRTASITFEVPENSDIRAAEYKLGISTSLASSVFSSLEYLIGYPYGCIEQTMSRFVPTVLTANTLKEMNVPEDPFFKEQLPKMVKKGYEKMYSMQNSDGGWGWWKNEGSDPYMSAYVLHSMAVAKQNGFAPDEQKYKAALGFVKNKLKSIGKLKKKKMQQTEELSTIAFMTYALSSVEEIHTDTSLARLVRAQFGLFAKKEIQPSVSPLAMAWLSLAAGNVYDTETQRRYIADVMRIVNTTAETGNYWGGKIKRYGWHNDVLITTSMVMKAIISEPVSAAENKDMVERAVQWLLAQKRGSSWGNTQQTAHVIYALTDYIKKYKELDADYNAKIFVNGKFAAEKHFTPEDAFKPEALFIIPSSLMKNGTNVITIEKSGTGKAYICGTLTYYESESRKEIDETDNGFEITREYYTLKKEYNEKAGNYTYKKVPYEGTGSKTVRSGDEMLVKVKVFPNSSSNQYFMLEEPLPSGCEYIKEDWAYPIEGENSYQGRSQGMWNWWYGDMDIRDNRIVFFSSEMGEQEYEFTYLLRAQIPGTYNIMPARGMLMYYPEHNGSSSNLKLKIIDK